MEINYFRSVSARLPQGSRYVPLPVATRYNCSPLYCQKTSRTTGTYWVQSSDCYKQVSLQYQAAGPLIEATAHMSLVYFISFCDSFFVECAQKGRESTALAVKH